MNEQRVDINGVFQSALGTLELDLEFLKKVAGESLKKCLTPEGYP